MDLEQNTCRVVSMLCSNNAKHLQNGRLMARFRSLRRTKIGRSGHFGTTSSNASGDEHGQTPVSAACWNLSLKSSADDYLKCDAQIGSSRTGNVKYIPTTENQRGYVGFPRVHST